MKNIKSGKITVRDPVEGGSVPFLRGILTRSLQNAGLAFEDAYTMASEIKDSLDAKTDVTTDELTKLVIKALQDDKHVEVLRRYTHSGERRRPIMVLDRSGQPQPFSKGHLAQALEICAFNAEKCYRITVDIERRLVKKGNHEISSSDLARLTHAYLIEHEGPEIARRYLLWVEFARSGRPLIFLVGGTTGSGKSTMSSELAHRLNIVRTQSTDMLREVMRLMIPRRLLPSLHTSSFNAGKLLPNWRDVEEEDLEDLMIDGYLTQAEQVGVGVEGVLNRAIRERVSLILEGVHIYPALQDRFSKNTRALVIPFIVAVLKRKKLRKQLMGRGQQVASRRSERYLENFEEIWQLQSFLLSEADRHQIPIIANEEEEQTMISIMEILSRRLEKEYIGQLENVA